MVWFQQFSLGLGGMAQNKYCDIFRRYRDTRHISIFSPDTKIHMRVGEFSEWAGEWAVCCERGMRRERRNSKRISCWRLKTFTSQFILDGLDKVILYIARGLDIAHAKLSPSFDLQHSFVFSGHLLELSDFYTLVMQCLQNTSALLILLSPFSVVFTQQTKQGRVIAIAL